MTMANDHAFEGEHPSLPPQPSDDLKALLTSVISRFDDADRRNATQLRELHGQIEQLRADARQARPNVPDHYRSGFERIEDGMTLLASKLAETYVPGAPQPLAPLSSISTAFAAAEPMLSGEIDRMNQAPLMSAAGPAARSRIAKQAAHGDTFDVIESPSSSPSEPWSPEEVAALNEIYSAGDMMFAPAGAAPAPAAAPMPLAHEAPSADRDWIDGRLGEITRLILESRAAPAPDKAITALSERFDVLERHLTEALRGIARAEDIGGLHQIESHISDLTTKVDQVHSELARFDALESRLGAIEERVEAHRAPEPRSEADLHAIAIAAAEAAAGRAAEHVSRDQQRTDGPDRVSEVHDMLASYMAERRQGDEQTAAILDTLQQAMVHLLDRVDTQAAAPAPAPAVVEESHLAAVTPVFHAEPALEAVPRAVATAGAPAAVEASAEIHDITDPIARQRASLQQSAQRAAQAQRDKQAAEAAAKGAKGAKPAAAKATGWRRLLVRGLVMAVAVGSGAGTMSALLPSSTKTSTVTAELAAPLAGKTLASVSGDVIQPDDAANSSVSTVITNDKPRPSAMTGIMIQDQSPEAAVSGAGRAPDQTAASRASASAADSLTDPGIDADQSKAALGLPPLSVGPLSLRMAAGNGDPSAEFEVASRLAEGKGTDQDLALAARWYQRSASKGFVQSQYRLGTLYERGLGVSKDLSRAKVWYQRAAEQGNVKSMHNLAVLAAGRAASTPDYATAAKWFAKAAENGLSDSQFNLAVLTESGLGVAKDKITAAEWYAIAARSGDRESIRRRDALRSQLSKPEQARVDAFVQSWQPQVPDRLANDQTAAGQAWKQTQQNAQATPTDG